MARGGGGGGDCRDDLARDVNFGRMLHSRRREQGGMFVAAGSAGIAASRRSNASAATARGGTGCNRLTNDDDNNKVGLPCRGNSTQVAVTVRFDDRSADDDDDNDMDDDDRGEGARCRQLAVKHRMGEDVVLTSLEVMNEPNFPDANNGDILMSSHSSSKAFGDRTNPELSNVIDSVEEPPANAAPGIQSMERMDAKSQEGRSYSTEPSELSIEDAGRRKLLTAPPAPTIATAPPPPPKNYPKRKRVNRKCSLSINQPKRAKFSNKCNLRQEVVNNPLACQDDITFGKFYYALWWLGLPQDSIYVPNTP